MKAKYIGDPARLTPCPFQGTEDLPDDYCNHCEGAIKFLDREGGLCPILGWDREVNPRVKDLFEVE